MKLFDYSEFLQAFVPPPPVPERLSIKRKLDSICSPGAKRQKNVAGDTILKQILKTLDSFEEFQRSAEQKQFHESFVDASLPHIFGLDWERNRSRVLAGRNLKELQQELLVCTPRRFGKTTSVSMFCAAMLMYAPNTWISIFSTGQRASTSLLDLTAKLVNAIPGGASRISKKNTEQLFLKGDTPGDLRRLFSYPSSVAGLKGVGAKIVILEEASRLDPEVFSEVIVPLLGVRDTTLIGISTPLDSSNFYSQLIESKKANGELIFKTLTIKTVCSTCQSLGETECLHAASLPSWKTGARAELVKSLMQNDHDMFLRENAGVITTADHSALDGPGVARFSKRVYETYKPDLDTIYTVIDPNGGGASQYAIVSFCIFSGHTVVIAADSKNVVGDDMAPFIRAHVENVRVHHPLAKIVLIIERNFGGSVLASHIVNCLASFMPIRTLTADSKKQNKVGIVTTSDTKSRGRVDLQRMLRLDTIGYAHDFITQEKNANAMKDRICKQLLDFKFYMEPLKPDSKKTAKSILSGKSYGKQDDIAMVFVIAAFFIPYSVAHGDACLLF